jgi:hypothetical protein
MLKLLNEVRARMPIEDIHPDLLWVAKNYPKTKTARGNGSGGGRRAKRLGG